jgi:hypothetical protein
MDPDRNNMLADQVYHTPQKQRYDSGEIVEKKSCSDNLSHCRIAHHRPHMNFSVTESGLYAGIN